MATGTMLAVAAVVGATKTAIDGYTQYQNAKSDIKYARNMQAYNTEQEQLKQRRIDRAEAEKQKDLARRHRMESGQNEAAMAARGLSMNVGSTLEAFIENETTQLIEANRLTEGTNEERYATKLNMQQANHALEVRKAQAKRQKQAAVTNTAVTLGGMAVGAVAGGMFGTGGFTMKNVASGTLFGGGMGGTAASIGAATDQSIWGK